MAALPKDPAMLLSAVNMKLRDFYDSLDALCDDLDLLRARASKKRLQASVTPTMPRKINLCKIKLLYRKER